MSRVAVRSRQEFSIGDRVRCSIGEDVGAKPALGTVVAAKTRFPGSPTHERVVYVVRLDRPLFNEREWHLEERALQRSKR